MKQIFTFLMLATSAPCIAQSVSGVLTDLNIPKFTFSSSYIDGVEVKEGYWGSTAQIIELEENELFSSVDLSYDELDELQAITYNVHKKKRKANTSSVFDVLTKRLGKEYSEYVSDYDGEITTKWNVDNFDVVLVNQVKSSGKSYLRVSPTINIKPTEKYDEFDKKTYISLINYRDWLSSETGGVYVMNFKGIKESSTIYMLISAKSKDWKFMESIDILIDGGDVVKLPLETSKKVTEGFLSGVLTNETGITEISKALAKSLIEASEIKMRINGENSTGVVTFSEQTKFALSIIYDKVFQ